MSKRGQHTTPADVTPSDPAPSVTTRLDQCGDVLNIEQLAGVLGLSVRTIEAQEHQRTFPIARIPQLGTGKRRPRKYAKVAIQRFLERRAG